MGSGSSAVEPGRLMPLECASGPPSWTKHASSHNQFMKLVRMSPGHGDVLLAEGDPEVAEEQERLIEEFRRQLDLGMWAAVPVPGQAGRREATMVREFSEVPDGADRVIFFPPAAGG